MADFWYNYQCLDIRLPGRFVFLTPQLTQYQIVGKAPLVSGLSSRRMSKQLRQTDKGRFVLS